MTATPRHRWFQFSLATMLVFVAVICVVLAVRSNRQHNRRVAIAKIEKLGGKIQGVPNWFRTAKPRYCMVRVTSPKESLTTSYSTELRMPMVEARVKSPKARLLTTLLGDTRFVLGVYFEDENDLTDANLACLLPFDELQVIVLGNNSVTDAGLISLASLPNVVYVELFGNTNVTDDGIARFEKALPNCVVWR